MALDTPILFAATTDAVRSRAFYQDTLGLALVDEDVFALMFQVGELNLRIQKVPSKPKIQYTVLGWRVPDIAAEVRRLAAAGVKFARYRGLEQDPLGIWRAPGGARVAWFQDPDDNTLSLVQQD